MGLLLGVDSIFRLSVVLSRYREYPDKRFGLYISDTLSSLRDVLGEIDAIQGKYERINMDILNLQREHSVVGDDGKYMFSMYEGYDKDVEAIKERHGWDAEEEKVDAERFALLMKEEREVDIRRIPFDFLPDSMNSVDLEMLRPVLDVDIIEQ